MSDYPRPASKRSSTTPYAPDGAVALLYIVLLLVVSVHWALGIAPRPDGFRARSGYPELYIGVLLLYVAALWSMARRRLGGFVAVLLGASLTALSSARVGNLLQSGISCLLVAYVLARLSGRLGPKPLRRRDLREV